MKVTKNGIVLKLLESYAGVECICPLCTAQFETEKGDKPKFMWLSDRSDAVKSPHWKIRCPECNSVVFIHCPGATDDMVRINGNTKK